MEIHYFQRYHAKENVATANTMLLLSRLYHYSPDKFYKLLKSVFFADGFQPEPVFKLQEKSRKSVPDATLTQEGFKIVVEAKMSDWFYFDQLERHLDSFKDEKNKVLITIAPVFMDDKKKEKFDAQLDGYNKKKECSVRHVNTTFKFLADGVRSVLNDRDYEMLDVLEDYRNYCYNDKLIVESDSWRWMRAQLAGTTFDFNFAKNLYYDDISRGFRAHDYLGLYKEKSVRAIGKITHIVTAVREDDGTLTYNDEKGKLTDAMKEQINFELEDAKNYGYNLTGNRYFFVEKFYETDFKKITPYAPMGSRVFDLTQYLNIKTDELPDVSEIAELLKKKDWE